MNHLQPIAFAQRRFGPLDARNNLAVAFDGNPIVLQSKLCNQLIQRGGWRERVEAAMMTIQSDSERHAFTSLTGPEALAEPCVMHIARPFGP